MRAMPVGFYQKEKLYEQNVIKFSIYDIADNFEDGRTFEFASYSPETKLSDLAAEIKIRIQITQQEIFKIGELLTIAKKVCQEEKIGFKEWIDDNLDFSYETAVNFMHVFTYCFGFISIAMKTPISILYKLSTPSFPEELRDYLFEQGNLSKMTNGQLVTLVNKYKEGGIEAIEDDIIEIGRAKLIERQTNYTLDICENALHNLELLKAKIETRGDERFKAIIPFDDQIKDQEPEAAEISTKLYSAISSAVESLQSALFESRVILYDYTENLKEKYFSPEIIQFDKDWEEKEGVNEDKM